METEQMAAVHGRPSAPRIRLSVKSGAEACIKGELTAGALAEFCRAVPEEAVVTVERREGGATVLRAEWATIVIPLAPTLR